MKILLVPTLLFPFSLAFADLKPGALKGAGEPSVEAFDGDTLPKGWRKGPGAWTVSDGVLSGEEVPADEHGGVLTLTKPFTDAAIRFRFKTEGARMFALSFNHSKGHLMRVALAPKTVRIIKDKDKKDPTSKPETLATGTIGEGLADGEWHTVLCEMVGEKILVKVDDSLELEASNPAFATKKNGHRFVIGKGSVSIDDVTIWQPAS